MPLNGLTTVALVGAVAFAILGSPATTAALIVLAAVFEILALAAATGKL